ncbi:hypothetical protein H112_08904 [Trichophyton rubrum D6]|uniref:Uncharacterized protein n=3 Tax=Trichophyton TaxID=5550 RepID=A0A080WIZ9_TRIRC|nr:uncharacterized protein TERG_11717 [Trichophyton rubrum CBS 118892]EZF09715.1 hypothetical protein H100_08925 [Trichophyton rubrum MR850]EZF36617.1 hypothetical protein H102_08884 [Trichophyton rubrum CBS 100081]EZF47222.1 hypothetical protein H103_08907 [Trichophyton rubrum CBS 288.86]EZF57799.1 hypothetical protein H104_08856 [Trichophyton rubrum CBS 289.86]EZF68499.1 hypothetical protein H105_08911 [Trichophyton soudanense CBS 452.61]EZF79088.1 hypothetical protein H110_08907 [Trichophy
MPGPESESDDVVDGIHGMFRQPGIYNRPPPFYLVSFFFPFYISSPPPSSLYVDWIGLDWISLIYLLFFFLIICYFDIPCSAPVAVCSCDCCRLCIKCPPPSPALPAL